MTQDDRFHEQLQRVVRELEPPPTPREAMWARIQAERAAGARTSGLDGSGRPHPDAVAPARPAGRARRPNVLPFGRRPLRPSLVWSAALAATLVIGIGLGRLSTNRPDAGSPAAAPGLATLPGTPIPLSSPYRLVATEHLQRTETLLTALTVDAGTTGADEFATWARTLLSETRLLLASPVARDPTLLRLLEDLELLLAQISAIPPAKAKEEVELIQDGINQSDVLLRLRAATTGRRLAGT